MQCQICKQATLTTTAEIKMQACASGKVEWYCGDVANIPIHPHLMTDVVDYDAGGPFR